MVLPGWAELTVSRKDSKHLRDLNSSGEEERTSRRTARSPQKNHILIVEEQSEKIKQMMEIIKTNTEWNN